MNIAGKVPKKVSRYYDSKKNLNIFYDKAVEDKDKIPGLVGFLNCEYEQLLETKGRFILDDVLSEQHMRPIPVILSNKCPKGKRYRASDDWVAKTIVRELQKDYSEDEKEGIVKKILKERSFQPPISGMYFHNGNHASDEKCDEMLPQGPYIELYYRDTFCHDEEDYKAGLSACLAHEYFHFLHDLYAGEEFNKTGWRRERVIESLADYFSFSYCLSKAGKITPSCINPEALKRWAKRRFNCWQFRFGSPWPYAFAYCFFYGYDTDPMEYSDSLNDIRKNGCFEKFNTVLRFSKISMSRAYKELTYNVPYI